MEKEEKLDRARVRDVLEGWNGPDGQGSQDFERGLRKVAQRGGTSLFVPLLPFFPSSLLQWLRSAIDVKVALS